MRWMDTSASTTLARPDVSKASFNMRIGWTGIMAETATSPPPKVGYLKYTYYVTFRGQSYAQ